MAGCNASGPSTNFVKQFSLLYIDSLRMPELPRPQFRVSETHGGKPMHSNQSIQTFFGHLQHLPAAYSWFWEMLWLRQTVNTPARTFGVVRSGWGSLPKEIFEPTENCCPPRPISKKILPLYSWRPLDYKSHIECTSSSRSKIQYICAVPIKTNPFVHKGHWT